MSNWTTRKTPLAQAVEADRQYLILRDVIKGIQFQAVITPPLVTGICLIINRTPLFHYVLQYSGRASLLYGPVFGGLIGLVHTWSQPDFYIRSTAWYIRQDSSKAHKDAFSGVGGVLGGVAGALSSPAQSGSLVPRTVGGAAIGIGTGVIFHYATKYLT